MTLTRAFFARPRGGRHSHAPGGAPDVSRPVHRWDEDVVVETILSEWWRSPRHVAKLVVKLNSNWAWHQSAFSWRSDFSKAWFDFSYSQAWERLFAVGSADRLFVLEKMPEVEMLHRNSAPVEI